MSEGSLAQGMLNVDLDAHGVVDLPESGGMKALCRPSIDVSVCYTEIYLGLKPVKVEYDSHGGQGTLCLHRHMIY